MTAGKWKSAAARRLREMGGVESVDQAVPAVVGRILNGIGCPPTDLEALCYRLNVAGVVDDDIPVVGELRHEKDALWVVCAVGQSAVRRRFTIAHELAHVLIESSGPRAPRVGADLERICDMLAAEILMPGPVFECALGDAPLNAEAIRTLASRFETSLAATAIRCADFQPISVVDVHEGRIRWSRGPARPSRHQLLQLMLQFVDGIPGDRLIVVERAGLPRFYRGDWIRTTSHRSGLLLLTHESRPAA